MSHDDPMRPPQAPTPNQHQVPPMQHPAPPSQSHEQYQSAPAPHHDPTAFPPTPPRAPSPFVSMLRMRTGPAAVIAAIAIGSTFCIAFFATMITLFTINTPIPGLSLLMTVPVQLLGAAVGGVASIDVVIDGLGNDTIIGLSAFWMPAGLTAALIAALFCAAAVDERRAPSTVRARWLSSALTGVVLATTLLLTTALVPAVASPGGFSIGATTASFTLVVGALCIGTLTPFLARTVVAGRATGRPITTLGGPAGRAFLDAIGAASVYAAVGIVVVTVVGSITVLTSGAPPATLLSATLWGPTAGLAGLALLNFSAVTFGVTPAATITGTTTTWLPTSAAPWMSILAFILLATLVLASSLVLALRRPRSATSVQSWFITAGVFAGLGVIVSIFGSVTGQLNPASMAPLLNSPITGTFANSTMSVGAVPWTFLVFAVIGVGVEASARFIAPTIASALPQQLTSVLATFGRAASASVAPPSISDEHPFNETTHTTAMTHPADSTPSFPAPTAPTAPTDTAPPVIQPMSPQKKKRLITTLVITGGSLAFIAIVAVTLNIVNSQVFSPQQQVSAYLDDVIAGDASAALRLADLNARQSDRVLLTDKILEKTESGITGYRIVSTNVSNESAQVFVDVEQDGEKHNSVYYLRTAGKSWLVFDQWRIDNPELPKMLLTVPTDINEIEVNGVAVDLDDVQRDEIGMVSLPLFPGDYEVRLPKDSDWFTGTTGTLRADVTGAAIGKIDLEPTKKLTEEVDRQIGDILTACAAQAVLRPTGCPFTSFAFSEVSDVVWTITSQPTITLAYEPYSSSWTMRSEADGHASVTYTSLSTFSGGPKSETEAFRVSGKITFDTGEPVVKLSKW